MRRELVVVRGGGDLGSGVAHRLFQAHFDVVILETVQPTVIRRTVAFASAIYQGEIIVEGVRAIRVPDVATARWALTQRAIPVLADPDGRTLAELQAAVIVDARMAKRNLGTHITDATVVIGLGPGFEAGVDVHAVVETQRGHDLGRVIWSGQAAPNTGVPGRVAGITEARVLRAPAPGVFKSVHGIGDLVDKGEIVAFVDEWPVVSKLTGVIRGMLHDGLTVEQGMKVGDVDRRITDKYLLTISDKARAIGGGVLEAILHLGVLPQRAERAGGQ